MSHMFIHEILCKLVYNLNHHNELIEFNSKKCDFSINKIELKHNAMHIRLKHLMWTNQLLHINKIM